MSRLNRIVYVTQSEFKRRENEIFVEKCELDGRPVREQFVFDLRSVPIKEVLEVDIAEMVTQEAIQAYGEVKEPCIVEHAGLIFSGHTRYPGGLTKPMWNALGDRFLEETGSRGRPARAQAVVAYCDGQKVRTFVGERVGAVSDSPRGTREFYWDTVFIPETDVDAARGKTYAEIVDDPNLGLEFKVLRVSQSTLAMLKFLEYRAHNPPSLWPNM
jgi:inosine/xanthosine triphosphate pyrophosphatase family protein